MNFNVNFKIMDAENTWKALGFKPIIVQNIAKIEDLSFLICTAASNIKPLEKVLPIF